LTQPSRAGRATPARELVSPYEVELPAEMEWEEEGTTAALALGFDILKSSIAVMTQGDLNVTWPVSQIGVTWPNKPALNYNTKTTSQLIINYEKKNPISGIEQVNVKLRCHVQYNGPEVQATFSFDPEGKRSRLLRDTYIVINNPLSLETQPTSAEWQRLGIPAYPVVRIPVEFRVDHPWPQDNYNLTFMLVLSGMYGFGATPGGALIENKQEVWN
jgi:hypothetical protein